MVRTKGVILLFLVVLAAFVLSGCDDPQKEIAVYGRFQNAYTEDRFEVDCNWECINPFLENGGYENNGLFRTSSDSTFLEFENKLNCIGLRNYSEDDKKVNKATRGSAQIVYGAVTCNSIQNQQGVGDRFFTEPMVEIYLYNPDADRGDVTPDYILGYRAVYSLDGELALEEGQWFLNEDRDAFCRRYLEAMLKVIGKAG